MAVSARGSPDANDHLPLGGYSATHFAFISAIPMCVAAVLYFDAVAYVLVFYAILTLAVMLSTLFLGMRWREGCSTNPLETVFLIAAVGFCALTLFLGAASYRYWMVAGGWDFERDIETRPSFALFRVAEFFLCAFHTTIFSWFIVRNMIDRRGMRAGTLQGVQIRCEKDDLGLLGEYKSVERVRWERLSIQLSRTIASSRPTGSFLS